MAYITDEKFGLPLLGLEQWNYETRLQEPAPVVGEKRCLFFEGLSLRIGHVTYQTLNHPYVLKCELRYEGDDSWVLTSVNNNPLV